ncbi:MAG: cation-translocating P-type ATPase [bacterium]|nr:cation-translocating P-type ATPase [bacterium]
MTEKRDAFDPDLLTSIQGLSTAEVAERAAAEGPNELPSARPSGLRDVMREVLSEPMFLLLLGCGGLYFSMREWQEGIIMLSFVVVIMVIEAVQKRKTERALAALRDLSSPRALVVREGRQMRIAGREVVRGDVVLLSEGDRVPADCELLYCVNLRMDESLLTGESVPVLKQPKPAGCGEEAQVFSGTLVVGGRGIARVTAIGAQTRLGKIGKALHRIRDEDTPRQRELHHVVTIVAIVALVLCLGVVVLYVIAHGGWREGFLSGVTLAMAMLPEEFPVVFTVFMALGAWRMAAHHVLTRRIPAVETLGATTVLCSDKTGTITQNSMRVQALCNGGAVLQLNSASGRQLPEAFHELVEYALLASPPDPFDPMEQAVRTLGEYELASTEHLHEDWQLIREYPLSPTLLAMSRVWQSRDGTDYVIAAKGAPEAMIELCHLSAEAKAAIDMRVEEMASRGLRVLGVARARFTPAHLPGRQHDFDFVWLGLIGLADPVRPNVPAAVRECAEAGIRVVMVTGDYPATAFYIAREIGLSQTTTCITGAELETLSEDELQGRLRRATICARVAPEQKLRIVRALKANGEIVAMTGDGVNDAPALKAAHIGIAMGGRGTDVAREAAALVLTDDDFSSIVKAVRMGRRIFDNLRKAIAYIIAIHVPIAGLSLLPAVLGMPPLLLPVHVVFLELIIDPACSIAFEAEPEEADIMRRPPRPPSASLFSARTVLVSVMQGLVVLGILLAVYAIADRAQRCEGEIRAFLFTTLIMANVGLILVNRSWTSSLFTRLRMYNPATIGVVIGALSMLLLVLYTPFLRTLFKFDVLHGTDLALCCGIGLCSTIWFELAKWVRRLMQPERGKDY